MADDEALVEKYRTTTRFMDALKIIARDPSRECERDVATALLQVEWAAELKPIPSLAQHKKLLKQLAKRLQADIKLAAKAMPPGYQMGRGKDAWIGQHRG